MAPFSPAKKRMARLHKAADSSASSDSQGAVKKPLNSMSAEELLDCMSDLDLNVLLGSWRLAMISQFDRIKTIMQDACEIKLDAHYELERFSQVRPLLVYLRSH
jgi:hypothetical protein